MKLKATTWLAMALTVVASSGCDTAPGSQTPGAAAAAHVDGKQFLLSEEPEGAVGVIAARESAEDGAPLVLVGRIGGSTNPWIEGRAAFTLLDASMVIVDDQQQMADGKLCLDDCCATERAECTTLVKLVDASGQVVPVDARQLLGVQESDLVVAEGTAKRDKNGNFSLLAQRIYVRN